MSTFGGKADMKNVGMVLDKFLILIGMVRFAPDQCLGPRAWLSMFVQLPAPGRRRRTAPVTIRGRKIDVRVCMSARILVVDDEPDLEALVLQKFRQQIRNGTVDFLFAHDGVEALATLRANGGIDLVVTDINMPRMDGLALLQKLQENDEGILTIIVSAVATWEISAPR